jgi:hypothetical protein
MHVRLCDVCCHVILFLLFCCDLILCSCNNDIYVVIMRRVTGLRPLC